MKAVVFHGIGDIRLDEVDEPVIQDPHDAIVRLTANAICGTDLHMIRGTMPGVKPGTILGHEGVGVVEDIGQQVRNFQPGDRVVIASTIACGFCSYCRAGYFSQCDNANPNGPRSGTAFFGSPQENGGFHGLQAEKARIPWANVGMFKLPDGVTDDQAIMLSDIFPTGYFGADLAEIRPGDTVAVFGCGPVGQFAILSALFMGAGRVLAVDHVSSRLNMARAQGAEIINFEEEDPVQTILDLTGGIGVDRAIDAVGVDAEHADRGPAAREAKQMNDEFKREVKMVAPKSNPKGDHWHPGDAPSMALRWEVQSLAKAGTLAIIGVYPQTVSFFPLGLAFNRNLTINTGNCHHRKYIPMLLELVQSGAVDPERILTNVDSMSSAIDAFKAFDQRAAGWLKVELVPKGAQKRRRQLEEEAV
ncbi:MAG: glutathione-dependent formaldehyde dehydrogenase [Candidatus Zixiibacteriota bacterium]|nr:MAG: glutathione-dependent formaldehyde dehydrogenase [candidate division Zixibacteria bacterium]